MYPKQKLEKRKEAIRSFVEVKIPETGMVPVSGLQEPYEMELIWPDGKLMKVKSRDGSFLIELGHLFLQGSGL